MQLSLRNRSKRFKTIALASIVLAAGLGGAGTASAATSEGYTRQCNTGMLDDRRAIPARVTADFQGATRTHNQLNSVTMGTTEKVTSFKVLLRADKGKKTYNTWNVNAEKYKANSDNQRTLKTSYNAKSGKQVKQIYAKGQKPYLKVFVYIGRDKVSGKADCYVLVKDLDKTR